MILFNRAYETFFSKFSWLQFLCLDSEILSNSISSLCSSCHSIHVQVWMGLTCDTLPAHIVGCSAVIGCMQSGRYAFKVACKKPRAIVAVNTGVRSPIAEWESYQGERGKWFPFLFQSFPVHTLIQLTHFCHSCINGESLGRAGL